ncbi:N-6 DNA methylase [uncultured Microscilla sp.]|uniref:restriction endonuclease subunit M n=1 Tax=uncultured Microscilla sp. TaxID=432653 RepID=UPI002614D726|nr:N-6 DNA methylase [uncultured Microscilla sp.]
MSKNLISKGVANHLIEIADDQRQITYLHQNKKRNYTYPEEQVQAVTFLKLILIYGYPVEQVRLLVPIKIGAGRKKEADIVVYSDAACTVPHIVVECKKADASEMEFKEGVAQAYSYACGISKKPMYTWITSGTKNQAFFIGNENTVMTTKPDIPRYGNVGVEAYKYAKGGRKGNEDALGDSIKQKFFDIETVSESDLTRRFKLAHNALWAGGELNPSTAFDELDKLIFCKIWDERKLRKKGEAYDFQVFNTPLPKNATPEQITRAEHKNSNELFARIKKLYAEGKRQDPEVFKDDIRLKPAKVKAVVGYLEGVNLKDTDLDSKGKAFETFMGSYFRGDFGQYFTPRNIVQFIINVLPITNHSRVLDTSCGSGGFLLYTLEKIRKQADEYFENQKGDPENDIAEGADHHRYWHDFVSKKLFGIEINEQIARTAKMNMIIHNDGQTNVIAADGLLKDEALRQRSHNREFKYNSFDFIVTNPPFGSVVKQLEKAYLHQYKLGNKDVSWLDTKNSAVQGRANQSTEVLFIEQCWHFLKEGGTLAIVVPDGILTNSSLQYVRDRIEEWYRIVAVVSMPQTAFAHTGAGVKSSVLFLKKWDKATTESLQSIKDRLKNNIKTTHQYEATIERLEKEKKDIIKAHRGFDNTTSETDRKAIAKTPAFKAWKKGIQQKYTHAINQLKTNLHDQYMQQKQIVLPDYSIFMAIAEDIGYDATGKTTSNNELVAIGEALEKFMATL